MYDLQEKVFNTDYDQVVLQRHSSLKNILAHCAFSCLIFGMLQTKPFEVEIRTQEETRREYFEENPFTAYKAFCPYDPLIIQNPEPLCEEYGLVVLSMTVASNNQPY